MNFIKDFWYLKVKKSKKYAEEVFEDEYLKNPAKETEDKKRVESSREGLLVEIRDRIFSFELSRRAAKAFWALSLEKVEALVRDLMVREVIFDGVPIFEISFIKNIKTQIVRVEVRITTEDFDYKNY